MKLSEDQIQDLYAFTRKHFVEHYDLQTELVDHLANDIESMWLENPKLSYEEAKKKAFKKYGVFGFMEPIEQKTKAMKIRYMRYLWTELRNWFTIPKIVLTVGIFLFYLIIFNSNYSDYFTIASYVVIGIWTAIKSIQLNRQFRRRKEISNKKWMLEEMIFKQAGGYSILFLSQFHLLLGDTAKLTDNIYFIVLISIGFSLLTLFNYISFELIPNKAEKLLNETYPEFSL